MVLLHVEQFDRKDIQGTHDLVASHEQWRRLFLRVPPFHSGGERLQRSKRTVAKHAEKIHVGELGMKIARHRRSEQDHALQVRSGRSSQTADKVVDLFVRNHVRPRFLPAAAGSATTGTAAAEAPKTTTPAKSTAAPTSAASRATTPAKNTREKYPEKNAAQRSKKNDKDDNDQQENPASRYAVARLLPLRRRRWRLRSRQLNPRVLRDDAGHA